LREPKKRNGGRKRCSWNDFSLTKDSPRRAQEQGEGDDGRAGMVHKLSKGGGRWEKGRGGKGQAKFLLPLIIEKEEARQGVRGTLTLKTWPARDLRCGKRRRFLLSFRWSRSSPHRAGPGANSFALSRGGKLQTQFIEGGRGGLAQLNMRIHPPDSPRARKVVWEKALCER